MKDHARTRRQMFFSLISIGVAGSATVSPAAYQGIERRQRPRTDADVLVTGEVSISGGDEITRKAIGTRLNSVLRHSAAAPR